MIRIKNPDFKALDSKIAYNYRDDLFLAVEDHGFKYLSELVFYKYYEENESVSKIAGALPITRSQVCFWMDKWGFERRERGGNTRNSLLDIPEIKKIIKRFKGEMASTRVAEIFGCSYSTVLNIWGEDQCRGN
ncbi:hypothetical protein [Desulfospira joergensenii]|uniref:hypothetical protein n=1 Tax=Desulfospira joergensenii TaxID=53329 RepID=UPI0003B3EC1B|nr:hypothetical protein [Desulfospira joergensenii]